MKTKLSITMILCLMLSTLIITNTAAFNVETCDPAYVTHAGHTIRVKPTGIDDTANLQCAFDTASTTDYQSNIHLLPGTFYTKQIVATDFHGVFRGSGENKTTIINLPELFVTPEDMYLNPPSAENPWPSLIAFVDGNFVVSRMSIHITGENPTTGWSIWGAFDPPILEMAHAIVILGTETHAHINHVTIEGEITENPTYPWLSYNLINGIFYEGFIGEPPSPISGSFQVQHSTFRKVISGAPVVNLEAATVVIRQNLFEDVDYAMDGGDFNKSAFIFSHNEVNATNGLDLYNSFLEEDSNSFFLINKNVFQGENGPMFNMTMGEENVCLFRDNNTEDVTDTSIYLGEGTKGCVVIGQHENVVDLGSGNVILSSAYGRFRIR